MHVLKNNESYVEFLAAMSAYMKKAWRVEEITVASPWNYVFKFFFLWKWHKIGLNVGDFDFFTETKTSQNIGINIRFNFGKEDKFIIAI